MIEIIQKGGLSSLYAGWRAVLCRNIPHSVIKVTWENVHWRDCTGEDII